MIAKDRKKYCNWTTTTSLNRKKTRCRLTGCDRIVPTCSVGRRTGHVPGPAAVDCPLELQMTTEDANRRQRQRAKQ